MSAAAAGAGCGGLVPAFIALNMLKKSKDLCASIPLGGNLACGSPEFMNELDRRALCTLFCCCMSSGGNQKCVAQVLFAADGYHGFQGHYKAETPYLGGGPVMSRNQPARPTRGRPGGSRIPDVVVVKDGSKPPVLGNIQKVYEMKFPGDSYSNALGPDDMTQQEAYKNLFGKDIDKNPMDAKNCGCDDAEKVRENASVLDKAKAWADKRDEAIAMKPAFNDDMWPAAASALGGLGAGSLATRAAGWLRGAAQGLGLAF